MTSITQEVIFNLTRGAQVTLERLQQIIQRSYLNTSKTFIIDEPREWLFYNSCLVHIFDTEIPQIENKTSYDRLKPVRTAKLSRYPQSMMMISRDDILSFVCWCTHLVYRLITHLKYLSQTVGDNLKYFSRRSHFADLTQSYFRSYFNSKELQLTVSEPVDENIDIPVDLSSISVGVWVLIAIGSASVIIGISSFIYNLGGKTWTDNGNSLAVPLFGLQLVDMFSDINLCVEIFTLFPAGKHDPTKRMILYVAGWYVDCTLYPISYAISFAFEFIM